MKDDFELQLRAALSRKEPPLGFAQRTIARAAQPPRRPVRVWVSLTLAATLLLAFAGVHRVREQRRADEAKQQLMLALKITSQKLAVVEKALDRSTN